MDDRVDQMVRQWGRERPDLPLAGVGVQARVKLLSKQFQRETDQALEPFDLGPWGWEVGWDPTRASPRARSPIASIASRSAA